MTLDAAAGNASRASSFCLLSLDGGGILGLSTLLILAKLMAKVNEGQKKSQEPWQVFDMIGG